MRSLSALLASVLVAGAGVAVVGAAPAAAGPVASPRAASVAPGTFVPVRPFRAADTRTASAYTSQRGPLAARRTMVVHIGGRGGVPGSNVSAVALTVSALTPTAGGGITVYANTATRPATTNLIYTKGRNTAIAAISRVSTHGYLNIYNAAGSGSVQIAVDVSGYYVGGTPSTSDPGVLHMLTTPQRAADTRSTRRPYAANQTRSFAVGHGVPTQGVGAVAVMLTALAPTRSGSLAAFAATNDPPLAGTTPFTAGASGTQFAVVPTTSNGSISISNRSAGSVQVVLDVVGWTTAGVSRTRGTLQPRYPARIANGVTVAANSNHFVAVAGHGGVPLANVSAVIASLTVARPTRPGALVAWDGAGRGVPSGRNLQFAAGQSVADLAVIPVSSTGRIWLRNLSAGSLKLFVDVVGFVPTSTITPPVTSTSHYIRNLLRSDSDDAIKAKMQPLGAADAAKDPSLVVLEMGAQTKTSLPSPGVLQTGTDQRLTYDQVRAAVTGYEQGFGTSKPVFIAVGTNNAGAYDQDPNAYPPSDRGTAWANEVVGQLIASSADNFTVVGANDIEASFDDSASALQHAQQWEDAYYAANAKVPLYFNGSLDNCPDAFGVINTGCTPGWTQDAYYDLAYARHPDQIEALPQVYTVSQATQWVNVDSSGGNKILFAGALTEYASCPTANAAAGCPTASYTGPNGWAALVRGLATLPGSHPVPAVSDLRID